MAIFNSYVKLPEGNVRQSADSQPITRHWTQGKTTSGLDFERHLPADRSRKSMLCDGLSAVSRAIHFWPFLSRFDYDRLWPPINGRMLPARWNSTAGAPGTRFFWRPLMNPWPSLIILGCCKAMACEDGVLLHSAGAPGYPGLVAMSRFFYECLHKPKRTKRNNHCAIGTLANWGTFSHVFFF